MTERNDLTRWNRAGLSRFRYVDGNAIEYLETLRQELVDKFADSETGLCEWLSPAEKIPANEVKAESETLIQRQERLSRRCYSEITPKHSLNLSSTRDKPQTTGRQTTSCSGSRTSG